VQITVNDARYRIDFRHERDWTTEEWPHVRGRTDCVVTEIHPQSDCPRHGIVAPLIDARCACLKTRVGEGVAYCSIRDRYTPQDGRKLALRRALVGVPRTVRGLFWKEFLRQVPQRVRVPRHEELRRVMVS
jgi:hypothetical protein